MLPMFGLRLMLDSADGILYYPEIRYRRVLNRAFGPGAWGLAPRGEADIGPRKVSREWGLVCLGRSVVPPLLTRDHSLRVLGITVL